MRNAHSRDRVLTRPSSASRGYSVPPPQQLDRRPRRIPPKRLIRPVLEPRVPVTLRSSTHLRPGESRELTTPEGPSSFLTGPLFLLQLARTLEDRSKYDA